MPWYLSNLEDDSEKQHSYTFIFHVFFSMQIINLFIFRLSYEPLNVFQKTLGLFGFQADYFKT